MPWFTESADHANWCSVEKMYILKRQESFNEILRVLKDGNAAPKY